MTRSRQTADWGSRAGLAKVIPSSVAVGSGTGSADSTGKVTFSGVSSIVLNDVFISTYANYRVIMSAVGTSVTALNMRLRTGSTDTTTGYYGNILAMIYTGTAFVGVAANNTGLIQLPALSNNSVAQNSVALDIFNPQVALHTSVTTYGFGGDGYVNYGSFKADNTTQYNSVTFYPSAGTMSGTVTVYGYN